MSWLQTIISACAAIGAIAAALATWWTHHDSRRPDVVAYLSRNDKDNSIYLVINNLGGGMAYDVAIDCSKLPCSPEHLGRYLHSLTSISVLAPGDSRSLLAFVPGTTEQIPGASFDIVVSFSSRANGHARRAVFSLEYESFASELWSESNEKLQRKAIVEISKSVKDINKMIRRRCADDGLAERLTSG